MTVVVDGELMVSMEVVWGMKMMIMEGIRMTMSVGRDLVQIPRLQVIPFN